MNAMTSHFPSNRRLWISYAIAAPIAPLSSACLVAIVALFGIRLGYDINPAAAIVLPVVALAIGLPVAYGVAGSLGMFIAFQLRRYGALNPATVLGAALLWAILFAAISPIFVGGDGVPGAQYVTWIFYVFALTGLPTLLSAWMFWFLVWRAVRD